MGVTQRVHSPKGSELARLSFPIIVEPGFRSWDRQRSEAQPFRSEFDGFLPLSRHRSAVLRGEVTPHSNDVRERKITLKFHSQTPSLLQDCTSRPAFSVYLRNPGSFDEICRVLLRERES